MSSIVFISPPEDEVNSMGRRTMMSSERTLVKPITIMDNLSPLIDCKVDDCLFREGANCLNLRVEIDKIGHCCSFRLKKVGKNGRI